MDAALTTAAFLLLIAVGAYLIHRLNAQQTGRIALHTHHRFMPGRRNSAERAGNPPPSAQSPPPVVRADRHDHRDGGRGRFPARRRRDRTTHKQAR
ncbi:hypothetical protein ACFYWS_18165 [Streptomyces sp. NPDC002795]|uniref:hypothetical protein n=1 Tax=Streptomyces sp. NPDC002795 TaxID=3364665 RepID=UPI003696DA57